jgi:hypothetical protein
VAAEVVAEQASQDHHLSDPAALVVVELFFQAEEVAEVAAAVVQVLVQLVYLKLADQDIRRGQEKEEAERVIQQVPILLDQV